MDSKPTFFERVFERDECGSHEFRLPIARVARGESLRQTAQLTVLAAAHAVDLAGSGEEEDVMTSGRDLLHGDRESDRDRRDVFVRHDAWRRGEERNGSQKWEVVRKMKTIGLGCVLSSFYNRNGVTAYVHASQSRAAYLPVDGSPRKQTVWGKRTSESMSQ